MIIILTRIELLYSFPVFKMQERHNILFQTIGYLDEEQDALVRGYRLLFGSFAIVIIGSCLEAWFFWLYNGSCHPFAKILKDPLDENKCKFSTSVRPKPNIRPKFSAKSAENFGRKFRPTCRIFGQVIKRKKLAKFNHFQQEFYKNM